MQVTLINSVKGKEVHGTDTGKKTGCGINLTRADNMSNYVKGELMVDLKEITCEKCKVVLAKRIIKESQKELSRELKEESKRATQGLPPIEKEPEKKPSRLINIVKSKIASEPEIVQPKPDVNEPKPAEFVAKQDLQPTYNEPSMNTTQKPSIAVKDDFLSQFAIQAPKPEEELEPKAEEKSAPVISKVKLSDELEQFAIPAPKAEEKPSPSIAKIMLDDELEQFAIPAPKAEEKPSPSIAKIMLDDELEQFAIPVPKAEEKPMPKAEEKPFNIAEIDDVMINPVQEKVNVDKMEEMSAVDIKIEDLDMSAMDEISSVRVEPVQDVEPVVTETVQKAAEIPTPKAEVQFQPSVVGEKELEEEEEAQPNMQEINTQGAKNVQQVIYNELGQPLYPVYNEKGQLFYTAVAPTKKQPEPEIVQKEEDVVLNQAPNPTIAALIAANAKKKSVIEESLEGNKNEPVVHSIEDALNQLGANVGEKKSKGPMPVFTEYKPPSPKKKEDTQVDKNIKKEEQNVPLTRAEIKRQKKLEKINSEFEKKLKERGFDLEEAKRKKRATR